MNWKVRVKMSPTEVMRRKRMGSSTRVAEEVWPAQQEETEGKREKPGIAIPRMAKRCSRREYGERI
jgi:hypothetical protein